MKKELLYQDEVYEIIGASKIEEARIINYLKATKLKVGLLINFGSKEKLKWERYILT